MTNKILCAAIVVFFFSCPLFADTYTSGDMVLTKPSKSSLNWDGKVNGNFDILASSVGLKASSQTWSGQNSFLGKVGIHGSTAAAYGLNIATTAAISGKLTTTVASSILDWTASGYTSSIWGVHNGATSGDDGFSIISDANSWNGRLDLGSTYGPQLHGKGAVGAPLLGLNNGTPAYAFDVTGGGRFTSTMTASAYYGDGTTLTGIATSAQLAAVAVSTGVLQEDLATEVSRATLRENDIAVSTGALEASKVNRAGDTMTGQLNVSSNVVATSSMTANYFQGGGAGFTLPVTGISLSEIEDLDASKSFSMGNKTLTWNFTNPSGGMLWNFTGAAAGHSLEVMQSGGNPSTDMHLLHLHAEDADPTALHLVPGASTSRALLVHANGDTLTNPGRFEMTGAGAMSWGTGAGATDTTLSRTGIAALQTNSALTATSFIGPLTGNADTATSVPAYAAALSTAVYTTGAQSIAGAKTFSDPLTLSGSSLTVTGAGNIIGALGVGISSPTAGQKLHILGDMLIADGSPMISFAGVDGTQNDMALYYDDSAKTMHIRGQGSPTGNWLSVTQAGAVTIPGSSFSVGGSTLVVTGGKVGIGTASPSTILSVSTSTNNAPSLTSDAGIFEIVQSLTGTELQMGLSATAPYPAWIQTKQPNNAGGTWPLALNPLGGNVGIGTVSPAQKLEVAGSILSSSSTIMSMGTNAKVIVQDATSSTTISGVAVTFNRGDWNYIGSNASAGKLILQTGAQNNTMALLAGGNVGIGDTASQAKLTVNGNIHSSGTVSGVAFIGSGAGLTEVSNLVSSGTVSVATGTINIAGLDGNADGEYRLVFFSSTTDSGASFSLYFNGDVTATNYYRAIGGAAANSSVFMFTTGMGSPNQIHARIDISRGADGHVFYSSQGLKTDSGSIVSLDAKGHHVSAQTNITSISITGPNNVMLVGTTYELYRSR